MYILGVTVCIYYVHFRGHSVHIFIHEWFHYNTLHFRGHSVHKYYVHFIRGPVCIKIGIVFKKNFVKIGIVLRKKRTTWINERNERYRFLKNEQKKRSMKLFD